MTAPRASAPELAAIARVVPAAPELALLPRPVVSRVEAPAAALETATDEPAAVAARASEPDPARPRPLRLPHPGDRPPAALALGSAREPERDEVIDRSAAVSPREIPGGPGQPAATDAVERTPGEAERAPAAPLVEQVVQRVVLIRRAGRHTLSIRLDPPELGALRIEAVLDGVTLHLAIRAEREPARDRLAEALPRLREALLEQGLDAGQVTVELGLDASGGQASSGGQDRFTPPELLGPLWPVGPRPPAPARPRLAPVPITTGMDLWA